VYWKKLGSESQCEHICRISAICFKYTNMVVFLVLCAVWPLLSWLQFGFTQVDSDYYALRYFFYFIYAVSQNIPYSAIDNMQMLIGDGFLMLHFASMLLFNTLRLKAMVFAMGPLLLFQNGKMALDILTYVKEPLQKSTFVRLIGQHDSVYLLIMFTLQV